MHLRQNAVTKEWVLFAPERSRRPDDFRTSQSGWTHERPVWHGTCPFCPGQEEEFTGGETLRVVDASGNWQVRSFPNRFPAIVPDGTGERIGDCFHRQCHAYGHHEVIAESPLHNTTLALMETDNIRPILRAWRDRIQALWEIDRTDHVVLFKNHGSQAGTSLQHPHSQLVSLPVAPIQARHRNEETVRYHDDFGQCVFCDMLEVERSDQVRVVTSGRHFTAFVPYAAYSSYSTWIVPHRHVTCYCRSSEEEICDLAEVLKDLLSRLYFGLHDPSYNLVVRLPSRDYLHSSSYHYYISIIPRLGKVAGFELGTGMFINPSLPENDAAFLRAVSPLSLHPMG